MTRHLNIDNAIIIYNYNANLILHDFEHVPDICTCIMLRYSIPYSCVFQALFDPFFISFYNVFYTSLPILALGLFDQVTIASILNPGDRMDYTSCLILLFN